MTKLIGFSYHIESIDTRYDGFFQSTSNKYADAVDELIEEVSKKYRDGCELKIKSILWKK
jgi:hypothetical protein